MNQEVVTTPVVRGRDARRPLQFILLGIGLPIILAVLGHWLVNRWSHVYITDSRVAARVITVSSESTGRVTEIPVKAGDPVSADDLLLRLDKRQTELQLQEIGAEIVRVEAEQDQLRARQKMVHGRIESQLESARAQSRVAEAEHRSAEAELEAARDDFDRVASLRKKASISVQEFEEGRTRFLTAQQQELRTKAGLEASRAALGVIKAEVDEITVLDRQIAVFDVQTKVLAARRAQQRIDLEARNIHAAFDGVIDATFVDAGEYVAPGSRLLMYHDPASVWIEANIKETDFRKLKIGAPAAIKIDAYPDHKFSGQVSRLGKAATSQFALFPNPNPSGNFTKITQRLPVWITIEQESGILHPGMMVEVTIDVVD